MFAHNRSHSYYHGTVQQINQSSYSVNHPIMLTLVHQISNQLVLISTNMPNRSLFSFTAILQHTNILQHLAYQTNLSIIIHIYLYLRTFISAFKSLQVFLLMQSFQLLNHRLSSKSPSTTL